MDSSVPHSFPGSWHLRSLFRKQFDVLNHFEVLSHLKRRKTSSLIWLMEFMSHFGFMTLDFMLFKFLRTQKYFPDITICLYLNLHATQVRLMWLSGTKQWVMPLVSFSVPDSVPSAQNDSFTGSLFLVLQNLQVTAFSLCSYSAHVPYLVSQTALVTQSLYFKECTKLASLMNQLSWKPSHVVLGRSCSGLSQTRSFFQFHFMTA